MRAAVLHEQGRPLVVEEVELEPPRAHEVLVRLSAAGVCHSDLSVARGDFASPTPAVLGHEGAGVVEAVGEGVEHVRPGDHVLLVFRAACGSCELCRRGRPALCEQGARLRRSGCMVDGSTRLRLRGRALHHFSGASTFAERAVVPAVAAVRVPRDVPLEQLAVVGCAVMTGVGAVLNSAALEPGASAVVIGCGGVGLSAVQGCAIAGAEAIVAVDTQARRLELAARLGATETVRPPDEDVLERVRRVTGGLGADYAFDAAGTAATLQLALDAVRPGGMAVAIGIPPHGERVSLDAAPFITTEKTLRGSFYGSSDFARDVPRLIELERSGRLDLGALVGDEVGLEDVNEALAALERDALARTIVRLG